MRTKDYVFLDLDGTCLDEQYCITDPALPALIKSLQKSGKVSVGLNSATPLASLQLWARELNANGPLIGERGAVILEHGEPTFLSDAVILCNIKNDLLARVRTRYPGAAVFIGDSVNFLRSRTTLPPSHSYAFLINGFRERSFGCHVRRVEPPQGLLQLPREGDMEWLCGTISAIVSSYVSAGKAPDKLEIDRNDKYGIVIVEDGRHSKTTAFQYLLARYTTCRFTMIGDSVLDFIEDPRVQCWAVNNATASLRERLTPQNIAKGSYASGVVELLQRFAV